MKRRLILLAVIAGGWGLWKGGFGFLATERTLRVRFPVAYGEIRRFELQVWDGEEALLKRLVEEAPAGLHHEPSLRLPLARGPHRAIAMVWLTKETQARTFQLDFDPRGDEDVALFFDR